MNGVLPVIPGSPEFVAMARLLAVAELPPPEPDACSRHFVLREGSAYGGLSLFGEAALLRSLIVDPGKRGIGLGRRMLEALLDIARTEGVLDVWLLTEAAERFFAASGFVHARRIDAPQRIAATSQFRHLCPSSAFCMRLSLS